MFSKITLLLALIAFGIATLPFLADFPIMGQDEPWIAAPAAKLATQGVFGNDLFTGYYGMDLRSYNFPPLFLISLALAFRIFGVGALQARMVAICFGAATLLLTYLLGRCLYDRAVGALAALLLVGLRLTLEPLASGVPFLDLARIARYDIAVPPFMLATLLVFVQAEEAQQRDQSQSPWQRWRYFGCGVLAGLALLTHIYGGTILAIIGVLLFWQYRFGLIRQPAPYLIALGCLVAILPWALFIAADVANYRGQMLPEQRRFRLWEVQFYLDSLRHEPLRYARFFSQEGSLVLWPRLGIWLALLGLPASLVLLVLQLRLSKNKPALQRHQVGGTTNSTLIIADQTLLIATPMIALLLALLVNLKFYNYAIIVLPFATLNLAFVAVWIWRWAASQNQNRHKLIQVVLVGAGVLAGTEAAWGIGQSLHNAASVTPYAAYSAQIAAVIPPRSRVLALHPYWFGVYEQQYQYRSIVLSYYLSDPTFYQPTLSMEEALARIAPEYMLIDQFMTRELQLNQPLEALRNTRMRGFRLYMQQQQAEAIAQINDARYGALTVYRLAGAVSK